MAFNLRNTPMRSLFEKSSLYRRASILIPFLAISFALGVLTYRSYHLSVRMEQGLNSFAVHYLSSAAEVIARRADVAANAEMFRAAEAWQQVERNHPEPDFEHLQQWLDKHPWIISAIYIPDEDPTYSIYVTELPGSKESPDRLTDDFFSASGGVRYTYSPSRLLNSVGPHVLKQSILQETNLPETVELRERSKVSFVTVGNNKGLTRTEKGYAVVIPLDAPLNAYGVRATVSTAYVSGWENHRVVSIMLAALAILLVAIGALFAIGGLRKESEAMNLRAALIANVSHELRTPLSMIRLGAETLKRSSRLKVEERGALEDSILREVIHLNHLVENVLDVARLQRGETRLAFTPLDPTELVLSLVSTYQSWIESKGFTLTLDIDKEIEEQFWDPDAVSRALLNLIDNAIKYSSDDKRIVVTLRNLPEHILIAVKDHGVGIESKDLSRIFEPYYRASFSDTETRRGAGLGLTLVRQIVRSHGGTIEVESTPGQGSTFRLLFPKRQAETSPEKLSWLKSIFLRSSRGRRLHRASRNGLDEAPNPDSTPGPIGVSS